MRLFSKERWLQKHMIHIAARTCKEHRERVEKASQLLNHSDIDRAPARIASCPKIMMHAIKRDYFPGHPVSRIVALGST
jgi:hypothetical protein